MSKTLFLVCVLAASCMAADYRVSEDSRIGFSVKKFLVKTVKGEFKVFGGNLRLDGESIAAFSGEIQIASVSTNDAKRDKHLLEPDFFDAANFAQASFVMNSYEETGRNEGIEGKITGQLTLHGVSKEVVFASVLSVEEKPRLVLHTSLNIKDFGIEGSMMNSNNVEVALETLWDLN